MRIKVVMLAMGTVGTALSIAAGQTPQSSIVSPTLSEKVSVAGYTKWTKVNAQPHRVFSNLAILCVSIGPLQEADTTPGPHNDKWVTVYVNSIGKHAMLNEKNPVFPVGSIIVSKTPESISVMRKREKGYNPTGDDWEYSVFDGTGTKLQPQGNSSNCQTCHAKWKTRDYVSRAYFTETMVNQLR